MKIIKFVNNNYTSSDFISTVLYMVSISVFSVLYHFTLSSQHLASTVFRKKKIKIKINK